MMPTNEEEYIYIASLINKQLHDKLSPGEETELFKWINESERNRQIYNECLSAEGRLAAFEMLDALDSEQAYARIKPLLSQKPSHNLLPAHERSPLASRKRKRWWPYAAAAVAMVILTLGILQLTIFQPSTTSTLPQTVDFSPAGHKAIITLSDGRNFELDTEEDKIYFTEDGIAYADGATLATTESSTYAMISTPRGGTYQLILADGTSVTLNAASSLTYPTEFIGPTRQVKLEGEAFFDVSTQPRPFIVETRSHTVEVLGTRFNVRAYEEEQQAGTTLVEGSVRLVAAGGTGEIIDLQPGEHGSVTHGMIQRSEADLNSELAWFEGRFNFDGKKLRQVMRELSRWYDVDIRYEGEVPDIEFFGGTFRNSSLATILTLLENTGITYRLDADRTVVLTKKD